MNGLPVQGTGSCKNSRETKHNTSGYPSKAAGFMPHLPINTYYGENERVEWGRWLFRALERQQTKSEWNREGQGKNMISRDVYKTLD